jgi:CHAT domain-containing protein
MHGQAPLTVGQLLETDGLGRPRLVVLSACETGLYDIRSSPDEFVGLPGTFIALGAVGVLGTLWPVSDAATALLVARFYELHLGERLSPPTALRRAQAWLREATSDDLNAYAKLAAARGRLQRRQLAEIKTALSADGLNRSRNRALIEWSKPGAGKAKGKKSADAGKPVARPYAHPYFWAGFIHTGL